MKNYFMFFSLGIQKQISLLIQNIFLVFSSNLKVLRRLDRSMYYTLSMQ